MVKSRVRDFEKAEGVLRALGLRMTWTAVEGMKLTAREGATIPWADFQYFLDAFELEAPAQGPVCELTFKIVEGIIMSALSRGGKPRRKAFTRLALEAPPVDRHIESLDAGMTKLHDLVNARQPDEIRVFLLMLSHLVRWQVLEDFAREWVGHWARGMDAGSKEKDIEILLTLHYGQARGKRLQADTRLYRNAIAHGGFRWTSSRRVEFWTRDKHGVRRALAPLALEHLAYLYHQGEIRLRTLEAIARVLRGWGRHADGE